MHADGVRSKPVARQSIYETTPVLHGKGGYVDK